MSGDEFDSLTPRASQITTIRNALIVPFGAGKSAGISRPAGVYAEDGTYLPLGECFRDPGQATIRQPEGDLPEPQGVLRKTWLYGGLLYNHFGHFLAESTGRLWAADHVGEFRGVVYLPKQRLARPGRFSRPMEPLLRMFGPRFGTMKAPVAPVLVRRLVLAPQGFGTGRMMAAIPEYRDFVHRNFGAGIPAEGAERIYISRSRLFSKRGRYLSEARIEALLEAEGYRIFHPQEHPIEAQIAQYRAATHIVSSDSSALHLSAFFADPTDRIAIILRRPGDTIEDFLLQYRSFAGVEPDVIEALTGRFYSVGPTAQQSEIYSELEFPGLGRRLAEAGYIRDASGWVDPPREEIEAERAELSRRLGTEIGTMAAE